MTRAPARRDRLAVAVDDRDERVARQAELAHRGAVDRRGRRRRRSRRGRAGSIGPTSSGASCTGGAGEVRPSRRATRSSVVPCTIVETTTTKKTALKIVSLCGTSEESTNVASTIGTAPRRPAQPSSSRSRCVKRDSSGRGPDGGGARDEHQQERKREAGQRHVRAGRAGRRAGRARRRARPARRTRGLRGRRRAAAGSATACCRRRGRRGRRRGSRCRRSRRRRRTTSAAAASDATGANAPIDSRDPREHPRRRPRRARRRRARPSPICRTTSSDEIVDAVACGALDPGDQAERERDRHRIVAARLGLERAREPAADVREAQRREHRGGVRRRDDGAEQERLEPREVEQRLRGERRSRSALTTTPTVLRSAAGTATSRSRRHEVCSPPS